MSTGDLQTRRKRLLIRSKRRGMLELDVILGKFAEENLANLDSELLEEYELLLNQTDRDAYSWIAAMSPAPRRMKVIVRTIKTWLHDTQEFSNLTE